MQEAEQTPKPLDVFKTELASVLENNAARLLENRAEKTDQASDPKVFQKKASQNSLVKLFSSRSHSTSTIHSNKSNADSTPKSSDVRISSTQSVNDNLNKFSNEVLVKRKEYATSKSLSSSDSDDSDIQYSKLPSNGKSRFFVALPAMTRNREKTADEPKAAAVLTTSESAENVDAGSSEFVRNVKGFGAQLRKSFFKRKSQRSAEKIGPLKQIRSDDDSSESEPEDVTAFMPQASKSVESKLAGQDILSSPTEEVQTKENTPEAQPRKKKNSKKALKKAEKASSSPQLQIPEVTEEAVILREGEPSKKSANGKDSKRKTKSRSNFYGNSESTPNVAEPDPEAQGNGLRQYFEEALGTEDSAKTAKRSNFSWFSRKRKSEKPEVAVAAKCSVDIGTQFPEVEIIDSDSRNSLSTDRAPIAGSAISEEMLWQVPREAVDDKEHQDESEMMFRCSSSHNEFPVHEPDYVPGDSELTLSSLDVTEKVNTVTAPTYYGSNPKPARIPIFSACCPAKATDLSVPYVKPSKDVAGNKSPKPVKEPELRERNPAIAIVKTVAKQVVDKLREREKRKRKTEATFYPVSQLHTRKWTSCTDLKKASSVDYLAVLPERRKSF